MVTMTSNKTSTGAIFAVLGLAFSSIHAAPWDFTRPEPSGVSFNILQHFLIEAYTFTGCRLTSTQQHPTVESATALPYAHP